MPKEGKATKYIYTGTTRKLLMLAGRVWLLTPGSQEFELPQDPQNAEVIPAPKPPKGE